MAAPRDGSVRGLVTMVLLLWLALSLREAALAAPSPPAEEGQGASAEGVLSLRAVALPGEAPSRQGERDQERLLRALEDSVDRYATPLQLLGTAPYYSNAQALELVLSYDDVITEAAARYDVEKAMVQAVLFQEIRFLNLLDEVDYFVEATHTYLQRRENYGTSARQGPLSTLPPLPPLVYRLDSSTGLGQIFADTAIQAINWQTGQALYDSGDWHDIRAVWSRLRRDDIYNIHMVALVLSHKRSILQTAGSEGEPSAADIMQAYNGTGELSRRYREVVCGYYAAFQQYENG